MKKIVRPAEKMKFAGSRDFGIQVRTQLEAALEEWGAATLDLTGIADMTPSFADECIGKLSEQAGADVTATTVSVVSGERFRQLLDAVIKVRLQRVAERRPA